MIANTLEMRVETGRTRLIAGLNEHYTMATRSEIPRQWQRFAPHIGNVPGQRDGVTYGVCWRFTAQGTFEYLTGVEVSGLSGMPEGFSSVLIPAGKYAVFTHREHVSAIPNTLRRIWSEWIAGCGYEVANTPSFERYGEDFDAQAGAGDIEIWVPIKA